LRKSFSVKYNLWSDHNAQYAVFHVTAITHHQRFCRLVARSAMKYSAPMKTLTVQEASQNLGSWLRRAAGGEQIAIHEGDALVLLQPLSASPEASGSERLTARDALRQLQSCPRLTAVQAEDYLREARAERLTDGRRNGQ
jgi:antitoxin (DNA-binding transcriptional repressor) of toxin-antitoxin stability system